MKKQENKNRRNFLLCMGGLLVLIVFAFAGPEGLLRLQDKEQADWVSQYIKYRNGLYRLEGRV
ncbi:MAG: hypothetical protein V8Q05_01205 [Lachnospiraceae bacterium]